jgi:hypothetical protein
VLHGNAHDRHRRPKQQRVTDDVHKVKLVLQKEFGIPVNFFAIPFNDIGQYATNDTNNLGVVARIVQSYYQLAFYQFKPLPNRDFRGNYNDLKSKSYLVTRIEPPLATSPEDLLQQMDASQDLTLPYTENFTNPVQWVRTWGNSHVDQNALYINRLAGSQSALVYLDGSFLWKDYNYSVQTKDAGSLTASLTVRFHDTTTYAACTMDKRKISVDVVNDNQRSILAERSVDWNSYVLDANGEAKDVKLSVHVVGKTIECYINDERIISGTGETIPPYGGVGVKLWNPNSYEKAYTLHDIVIEPILPDPVPVPAADVVSSLSPPQ